MILSDNGKALLKILIPYLEHVEIRGDSVRKCPTYSEILHEIMPGRRLERGDDAGKLLKHMGLDDLAEWTKNKEFPAITGLIVRKTERDPGIGYYNIIKETGIQWHDHIKNAKNFNWKAYL
ncbi:hypothetical protein [Neokomagataea thailandica]|uniref:Transposase n=1 Tax=Neokomagataea tanensis NBRC 106556 TaxID=1223519 RepID=A0ABQ0QJM4_9PROT|nr:MULTISPECIES: hypothetical protein [Neokomagataea]GBR47184.1 hypothetical protein AA106556_1364 [Neokomagataea tanensis NBRC 106556]